MNKLRGFSSAGISMIVHVVILVGLLFVPQQVLNDQAQIIVETFFSEERDQQEFSKELEVDTRISETDNVIASTSPASASTSINGGQGPTVSQTNIATSESLKEPELFVRAGDISMPGQDILSEDIGTDVVKGGTEAIIGYGAALSRISQELVRIMRKKPVHAVWLFDESNSMKDDQERIRQQFDKVYVELGIQIESDERLKRGEEILLTTILGFGKSVHSLTPKPTSDLNEIRSAINNIAIDESGLENTCAALGQALDKFGPQAIRAERQLVIILVSDESGDDGQLVEQVIERTDKYKTPVYVLGRESVFGYPYARIRWKDPKYGLTHWLKINRGPETPQPECLQWDGFHSRWDADRSGFGPYEQVRIARESGGVYFMLPGEEQNLAGRAAADMRRFEFLDLKEYLPDLEARRAYEAERAKSEFRTQIWNVIVTLNPHLDEKLNLRYHHYSMDPAEFRKQGLEQFQRAGRAMTLTSQALAIMDKIEPLRDEESSQRWRAHYDLITAQLLSYRVRLFQFLLALDRHAANPPQPKSPKSNEWDIDRIKKMTEPSGDQFERLKKAYKLKVSQEEFLQELKNQEARSRKMYQAVIEEHPRTPWARRASKELSMGYGVTFVEDFHDPLYRNVGKDIILPKQ